MASVAHGQPFELVVKRLDFLIAQENNERCTVFLHMGPVNL